MPPCRKRRELRMKSMNVSICASASSHLNLDLVLRLGIQRHEGFAAPPAQLFLQYFKFLLCLLLTLIRIKGDANLYFASRTSGIADIPPGLLIDIQSKIIAIPPRIDDSRMLIQTP